MIRDVPPIEGCNREAAVYIADMAGGLAMIARRNGFGTISYLLDMARLEAGNIAKLSEESEDS